MRVVTAGTFDMLHRGHLNLLKVCRLIAGTYGNVDVCVNSDGFVKEFKGEPPVHDHWERIAVLEHIKEVSRVIGPCERETLSDWLRSQPPSEKKILVVGTDWVQRDYFSQIGMTEQDLVNTNTTLIYVPYTTGISTSALRKWAKQR